MNRRFTVLLSVVVVVGLGLGALIASITTPKGPMAQSVAFAQDGAASGQGQGNANRPSANGGGQAGTGGQGMAPLIGSVTSLDGNTLTVNSQQGEQKVDISGAKIQKSVDGTAEDLKAGESVVASGQRGSDGVLAATSIQIRPEGSAAVGQRQGQQSGQGQSQAQAQPQGQRQGQDQAQSQGQRQGQGQGPAEGQDQGNRPVAGTISSVSGDTATLTTQQGEVKVKITGARIQKTIDATTADLKAGERVMVTGQKSQDGGYRAINIQIVPETQTKQPSAG